MTSEETTKESASFRTLKAAELERVQTLAHVIWREYYPRILSAAQIDYMLATGYDLTELRAQHARGVIFELIMHNGADVGLAYGATTDTSFKLHKLYLFAHARGHGLGAAALRHVEAQCRVLGGKRLTLNVNKHNAQAIRAYERVGFTRMQSVEIDIGQGYIMDDYVYEKLWALPDSVSES